MSTDTIIMKAEQHHLPQVGDPAPFFSIETPKGAFNFPDYSLGSWCIFFAHPANFSSAWTMYSAFLAVKERWLTERNAKLLALSTEALSHNNGWSDKARRYIGIYLKAPVVEDLDFTVANLYGMASGSRLQAGYDRVAFIIDPEGIIRMIINRPLPSIETTIQDIQDEFDRMMGNVGSKPVLPVEINSPTLEVPDAISGGYKPRPAYFRKNKLNLN
ncbi:MAG: redoxin domain-containing protein [Lewinellaceae bacterium]|nr:redoxin domain-containing protein [Lewinellaceae bacterium]